MSIRGFFCCLLKLYQIPDYLAFNKNLNQTKAMKNKKLIIGGIVAISVLILGWYFGRNKSTEAEKLTAIIKKGDFEIAVNTTGELRAKNQTDVKAPSTEMEEAELYNGVKIQNLVPEGSVVKAGEFVASLDQSAVMNKMNEANLESQKKQSELNQAKLDTTLTLRDARDELSNLKFQMEQNKLEKEQSVFEAPAIQKMKDIELTKALKAFEQKKENYKTKVAQAITKIQIVTADFTKAQGRLNRIQNLMGKMTIMAPKDGMVIYHKDWSGRKKIVGSEVSPWNSTVATLPDLSEMQVLTYVNEVDVQKIKVDQLVEIKLDADPKKKLSGVILSVANVGEQRPNSDAKVFEVIIDVLTRDADLRPSMTTSCKIYTATYKDVLSVPLEAINNQKGKSFIYKKDGSSITKQEIKIAAQNDVAALIFGALKPEDIVLLSAPTDTLGLKWFAADKIAKVPMPIIDKNFQDKIKVRNDSLKKLGPATRSADGGGGNFVIIQ